MKNQFIILTFISMFMYLNILESATLNRFRLSYRDDPSTTVVIGWNGSSSAVVYYGDVNHGNNHTAYTSNKAVDRTVSHRGMTNNFARLSGLTPNTVYYFVVRDPDGTVSEMMSFKTMPDDPNVPVSFVFGGDSRTAFVIGEERTPAEARAARQRGNRMLAKTLPDFVCFNGDYVLNQVGSNVNQEWADWLDDWQMTKGPEGRMIPLIHAFGNHEDANDIINMFDIPDFNNDAYYALTIGGNLIRLYTLNSEANVTDQSPGTQTNWFKNDLIAHTGTAAQPYWKIVQYHTPMVSHGTQYDMRNDMIQTWAPLFRTYKVKLAMESHVHVVKYTWPIIPGGERGFQRNDTAGTVYIGEGSWGAPLRNLRTPNSWTRAQDRFDGIQLICVTKEKMEVRTIKFLNEANVQQNPVNRPHCAIPQGAILWTPATGEVVEIINNTMPASIDKNTKSSNIQIFPNPNNGIFNIDIQNFSENTTIEIYNGLGKLIEKSILTKNTKEINISNQPNGAYFIYLKNDNHVEYQKIILQK